MADDWPLTRLGDVAHVMHGFAFDGALVVDEPTPNVLVTPGNFEIGGGFKLGKFKYYQGKVPSEYVLKPRDLVVTMTDLSKASDTLGYSALVPALPGHRFLHNQRIGKVEISNPAVLDHDFLYWLLRTSAYRNEVLASSTGTSIKHTAPRRIEAFCFRRPPISEQRAIAHILGTLDDKIDLNRRMNETLETMARSLFKSWFLDFDPVRAKAEGRDAGLPQQLDQLFPDSFEDSELGQIPRGFAVKSIESIAQRVGMGPFGSSIKVETFTPNGIPVVSGQHLRGFMMEDRTFNFVTAEHAERLKSANVQRGDVIFTHAGNIGQVAYIPETSRYDRYVISQRQFFMRCDLSQVTPSFVSLFFRSPEGQQRLLANASSSGVPSIARPVTYLRSIRLTIPPKLIMDAFEKLVQPLLKQFQRNLHERSALAALRDTLLPKLTSGEIRVANR